MLFHRRPLSFPDDREARGGKMTTDTSQAGSSIDGNREMSTTTRNILHELKTESHGETNAPEKDKNEASPLSAHTLV